MDGLHKWRIRERNINPEVANNRNTRRRLIHNGDPEYREAERRKVMLADTW